MDSGIQMFTTDSVSTISSGKIVAQTSTFEQTSMTDDDPGVRIIGDNKVELVYKNRVTNEEASIDLYNSNNSSNNAKLYIDNPRGTTSLIIDQNRRLGIGNIVPEAILHLHNHNNSNSEHIRITNNDNLGMNMILTSSNTDIKANFGIRWYNSGSTSLVNNALVIRNLNGTNTIGIGTSTPSYTLDVSGTGRFTGTLTANVTGNLTGNADTVTNGIYTSSSATSLSDITSVGSGSIITSSERTKLSGIATSANNYTLPTASGSTLGGIKVGTNLSISSGVLSATDTNTTYSIGDGGLTQKNFTDTLKTKLDGITASANNYTLPTASGSTLGGIKVGTNLSINGGGVLSSTDTNTTYSVGDNGLTQKNFTTTLKTKLDGIATSANNYTLPTAASGTLGGIKVGTNLSISSGVLSATDTNTTYSVGDGGLTQNNFTNTLKTKLDGIATSANNYSLPTSSTSTLGGVKVGTNLSISSGVLSATDTNTTYSVGDGGLTQNNFTNTLKTKLDGITTSANNYSLPTSSTSTLGGVKVDGSTITINGSGVITSSGGYTLPTAASDTLGGVKVGTNLSISSGVLSATDTNTTYSVGDGGLTQNNFTNTLKSKLDGIATSANNYTLPTAASDTLGGIKVGTNLSISSGVLSATDTNTTYSVGDGGLTQKNFTTTLKTKLDGIATSANNYTLPTAASGTLGGIKVGTNLSISSGVLSATDTNTTYSVGDGGLTQNNFTDTLKTKLDGIATSANNYSLPTSSTSTLGGVKVDGSTITINGSGVISSSSGTLSSLTVSGDATFDTSTLKVDSSNNRVGIGTTSPDAKLEVSGDLNLAATNDNWNTSVGKGLYMRFYGGTVNKGYIQSIDRSNSDERFPLEMHASTYTFNSTSGQMFIDTNGNVGIGTQSPDYPLHIYGSVNADGGAVGYIHSGGVSTNTNANNDPIGLKVEKVVWSAMYIMASSDRRIKENIQDVPDNLALEQVRNIPCRYYEYKDKVSRGSGKTIGFIAQEVKSVLPMATSIQTSIIPNVYTNILDVTWEEFTEKNVEIITETNPETGIETNVEKTVETKKYKMKTATLTNISGVNYKFYVSNTENDEVEKIVTGNDDSTFTFGQQWNNVFCYGYEVEDFHTIDKNKLFTINFSATQEIDRIQQQELTKVKDLEIENFLLKERVKDLESQMNDVLNRLAQIENN